MSKPEGLGTFYRDYTFHGYRRLFGDDIPATDIDFLEFDHHEAVGIVEQKTQGSKWKEGQRTDSLIAMHNLAKSAGIPLYVAENCQDWATVNICTIDSFNGQHGKIPHVRDEICTDTRGLVRFEYHIRGRKVPPSIEQRLQNQGPEVCPGILTPTNLILELFSELTSSQQAALLEKLNRMI